MSSGGGYNFAKIKIRTNSNFAKSKYSRIRTVAYFTPPRHACPVFAEFRPTQRNRSKWRKSSAGALGKFPGFAGESRDFLKILRILPRIRGVAYFGPPTHARQVHPVFAELRQIQRNPIKWRRPTVRGN